MIFAVFVKTKQFLRTSLCLKLQKQACRQPPSCFNPVKSKKKTLECNTITKNNGGAGKFY